MRTVANPADRMSDTLGRKVVAAAFSLIEENYVAERHQIGAALLHDKVIHPGVHLDAMVGRAAACAEIGALSNWKITSIARPGPVYLAAVRYPKPTEEPVARIVPPCGLCRELIFDHIPHALIVTPDFQFTPVADLIPHKYVGTKWAAAVPDPAGAQAVR